MANATDADSPLLTGRQMTCRYGDRRALTSISIQLAPGQLMALVGPNGSGKSTLLRALSGVIAPSSGAVTLAGADLPSLAHSTVTSRIIYLPQQREGSIAPTLLSVGQYLALAAGPRGSVPGGEPVGGFLEAAIERHLAQVGLDSRWAEPLANLSAGQQQRIALARVLLRRELLSTRSGGSPRPPSQPGVPPLAILLDEPTSAMDPKHVLHSLQALQGVASSGDAVLLATHDLLLAQRCPFAALLRSDGTLAAAGPSNSVITSESLAEVFELPFEEFKGDGAHLFALPSP